MRRPLTDRDWDMVEHYARHGSLDHTGAAFRISRECVRRRVLRIAPCILRNGGPLLGGVALRYMTEEFWEKRACDTTKNQSMSPVSSF